MRGLLCHMPRAANDNPLGLVRGPKKPRHRRKKEPPKLQVASPWRGVSQIKSYADRVDVPPRLELKAVQQYAEVAKSQGEEVSELLLQRAKTIPSSLEAEEYLALHATVLANSQSDVKRELDTEAAGNISASVIPDSEDDWLLTHSQELNPPPLLRPLPVVQRQTIHDVIKEFVLHESDNREHVMSSGDDFSE